MAEKSQIATTIEQSKRLLKAGIAPESADLFWTNNVEDEENGYFIIKEAGDFHLEIGHYHFPENEFPAWSLSKLWDICNDSGIGPLNFGGDDIDSSSLIEKLVHWIILGVHDYEVLDEYLTAETIQELNLRANAKSGKNML